MTEQPIIVKVDTVYLSQESEPDNSRFVFAYQITIQNRGNEATQLLSRHWVVTDSNEGKKVYSGMGVVGEQPLITAGQSYKYSSGIVLDTPVGTMQGHYTMRDPQGCSYDVPIEPFLLSTPNTVN
jgi:ApaG protein